MSKVKYYYDSETLSYRKIEQKKGRKLGIVLLSLLGIFLSGFVLLVIYLNLPYVETPREKALKRELAIHSQQSVIISGCDLATASCVPPNDQANKHLSLAEKISRPPLVDGSGVGKR